MKRILTLLAAFSAAWCMVAQPLPAPLTEQTLRVDYVFSGTDRSCTIALDQLSCMDGWAGRRVHLDSLALRGNGQIRMHDAQTGRLLYCNSFSTLFQEWQATEEATRVQKSFENVFLLPMPSVPVDITVVLFDFRHRVTARLTHRVDPSDILIRRPGGGTPETRDILRSGSPASCIDVVILSEGYTADEMDTFYQDAAVAVESFMNHRVFRELRDRFNFVAVALPSAESGVSVPREGLWKDTALGSHFDTFYSDRYLTTLHLKRMHDLLTGVPYEHIIILANTDTYGGGGIFNSYTLTTAHHAAFRPVVVHEFGHSFAGLADEYFYDDQYSNQYFPDVEPWEQNITTRADFSSKWKSLMGRDGVGLFEGGGYMSRGVWRGSDDCRMRTNTYPDFCPVCSESIRRLVSFYTGTATP
ncbi:MAG: IgA Peptidase M64 [Bacteroidales bacterium]|nr:IgA Peptidase M64 [Bacteroidales bacterium]